MPLRDGGDGFMAQLTRIGGDGCCEKFINQLTQGGSRMQKTYRKFHRNNTSQEDIPLFKKLGLTPFSNLTCHQLHYIGEVKEGKSYVKIYVTCEPAQFFDFEFYDDSHHTLIHIKTGSGCIADFWPTIEKMMQGMLVVTSMENVDAPQDIAPQDIAPDAPQDV